MATFIIDLLSAGGVVVVEETAAIAITPVVLEELPLHETTGEGNAMGSVSFWQVPFLWTGCWSWVRPLQRVRVLVCSRGTVGQMRKIRL